MNKWADYLISAVRYEEGLNSKSISHFKIHIDNGDSVGEGSTWTKLEVFEAINKKKSFLTIIKDERGKWKKGMEVFLTKLDKAYLRTDSENIMEDDLRNLNKF